MWASTVVLNTRLRNGIAQYAAGTTEGGTPIENRASCVAYMNRFRAKARPPAPERDPEPECEVRASEAIIDAEVIDLPDDPQPEPSRIEQRGDNR